MLSDEVVVFDNLRATMTLVVHADPSSKADLERASQRLDEIAAKIAQPLALPRAPRPQAVKPLDFVSGFSEARFCAAVERIWIDCNLFSSKNMFMNISK